MGHGVHIHREGKMSNDRREFMKLAGAIAAAAGVAWAATPVAAQVGGHFKAVKALAFDAYGTLFDVFSVTALCEQLYPGKGNQLAQIWRVKQLQSILGQTPEIAVTAHEAAQQAEVQHLLAASHAGPLMAQEQQPV